MIPEIMYEALLAESNKIGAFGHGFTYGGHPVSAAVAVKAIEIYRARPHLRKGGASARRNSRRGSKRLASIRWSAKRAGSGLSAASNWSPTRGPSVRSMPQHGVGAARRPLRRGRRLDRALGDGRCGDAVAAACHQRARDRRAVRSLGARARQDARLGDARAACWPREAATRQTANRHSDYAL